MSQVEKWIEVNAPVESVFALFSGLSFFPRWMGGILRVESLEPRRTRWTAQTLSGQPIEWEVETTVFEPNCRLAWKATTGPVAREIDAIFEESTRGTTLVRARVSEGEGASTGDDGPGSFAARLEADLARFKLFAERESQEGVQPERENAMPVQPAPSHLTASRDAEVVTLTAMAEEPPVIQTPPGGGFNATPARSARSRTGVDRRAPRPHVPREPRNLTPLAAQRPVTARLETRRRQPILGYLLLGALLALLLGAVWFFLNHRPSDGVAVRTAAPRNTLEIPNVPGATAAGRENARASDATAGVQPSPAVTGPTASPTAGRLADARASVVDAINEWVAATNARDVERQMSFYAPVVQRYYRKTYVSRNAARADKQRRLGDADSMRVSVDEPQITWERDGRVANVRFRKQYEIESRGRTERGAVVQQLFLSPGDRRWQIFSERDLRVIR